MQTFLPHKSFIESAKCLDNLRLGKQRVECLQIYDTVTKPKYLITKNGHLKLRAWVNHPACRMWKGYQDALVEYAIVVCKEWIARGFKDTILARFEDKINSTETLISYPKWLGNDDFHTSHKSNLLRKNIEYYSRYNWAIPANLPYIWPVDIKGRLIIGDSNA